MKEIMVDYGESGVEISPQKAIEKFLEDSDEQRNIVVKTPGRKYFLVGTYAKGKYNFLSFNACSLITNPFDVTEISNKLRHFAESKKCKVYLFQYESGFKGYITDGILPPSALQVVSQPKIDFVDAYKQWDDLNSEQVIAGSDCHGDICMLTVIPVGKRTFIEINGQSHWDEYSSVADLENLVNNKFRELFLFDDYSEMVEFYFSGNSQ